MTEQPSTAKARYTQLTTYRDTSFLERARECAKYTIPTLVPPEGATHTTKYYTPYQSLGARGVNNLASKLLLALLPPNSPFFRLAVDDFTLEQIAQKEGARGEVEEALNRIERAVMTEIETTPTRAPAFEAIKHLLVSGNVLIYMMPKGGFKVFGLDKYVAKRDPSGTLMECITKECITPMDLPAEHRAAIMGRDTEQAGKRETEKVVEVYTHVRREGDRWMVHQEANGMIIPGTQGSYPLDKSAWLALRFIALSGEDYGRGFVEEHLGDIKSLEGLSKAIIQASAVASKVLFLVRPNATTKVEDLARKESGDFATGNVEDVTVLTLDKFADFRVTLDMVNRLTESLSFSFLMNTAIQRNAERVTAEEIRFMANELETGLGGVYSTLSQEFQLPLVTRLMHTMERAKKLPSLPKGVVRPMISTGIEAIGRGNDLTRLAGFLSDIAPLGEETVARYLDIGDFIKRVATARGIDQKGLVKTQDVIDQEMQQQQMMAAVQTLGPNAINKGGDILRDQVAPSQG